MELLSNYLGGRWVAGSGAGTALFDPVLGNELVRVDATGLDLAGGFAFAREHKAWWMIPVVGILLLVALLTVTVSTISPFIYSLF